MSVLRYAWGVAVLSGSLAMLVGAAGVLTRRFQLRPGLAVDGLARAALVLCWVFAVSYPLGTVGQFRPVPLLVALNGGALVVLLMDRYRPAAVEPGSAPTAGAGSEPTDAATAAGVTDPPETSILVKVAAGLGAALAVVGWLPEVAHSFRHGMLEPDSTWYHGHTVGQFLQTGWLSRITPVGTDAMVPFHPANREVLDALLIMPWQRDLLLPLVSLAGLGLLLLAGWCIGARWQRGPAALLVTALVASPATTRVSQPGSLKNDLLAAAFLLAGIALLVHSRRRLPGAMLAGAMLGLAIGTRTNLLLPMVIIALGGIWWLLRSDEAAGEAKTATTGKRWLPALGWMAGISLFGSYWYLRNWLRVGNPLPWMDISLGPIHLSQPGSTETRYFETSLWYWRDDPDLISKALRPGMAVAFGQLWWVWGVLALACLGLVIARRALWPTLLAVAGCAGLVAHATTPLTLVVEPSSPLAAGNVAVNMRYVLPAYALILLAGVCATRSPKAQASLAGVMLILLVDGLRPTVVPAGAEPARTLLSTNANHTADAGDIPLAVGLAAVLAGIAALVVLVWPRLRDTPSTTRLAAAAVPALLLAVVAYPAVESYLDRRYSTDVPGLHGSDLWPEAQKLDGARIGMATTAVPYPLMGADFSNRVEYIGAPDVDGLLRNAETCPEWVDALASRAITHVALTPDPFANLSVSDAREWTLGLPDARIVHEHRAGTLIELPADMASSARSSCQAH